MRRLARWIGRIALGLAVIVAGLFLFGPREPLVLTPRFDPTVLPADLDAYLADSEGKVAGLTPGVEKRILWMGKAGVQTDIAVVYLHGFSATSEEIRPVPDLVAKALGANLYYARYAGHGLPGDQLAGPTAQDWIDDTAEALAIGRRIGRKVIVISTSTGGTMAAVAALQPELRENVAGFVFVSPNFGIRAKAATLLTWPLARHWAGLVAGDARCFTAANARQAKYWTTCYPTVALLPVAALATHAGRADYSAVKVPALFLFSENDQVVDPAKTKQVAQSWGGQMTLSPVVVRPGDDAYSHVIAGDTLSPSMTAPVAAYILEWVRQLGP